MEKRRHFKASVTYLGTEDGGIATPVSSGFRAFIRFPYDNRDFIASQTFLESEIIFAGDTTTADFFLPEGQEILEKLYTGLDFDILLNLKMVGSGVITEVYPINTISN